MSYLVAGRSTLVTATANAPLWAFRAVTRRCYIYEVTISGITAPTTSGAIGITRSTALGTGTLTSTTGQPLQPEGAAATALLVTNWATAAPTISATAYLARIAFPASIGNTFVWSFAVDHPLEVPGGAAATSEIVFTNLQATAPGTYDITIRYLE
jgi:hypothetical protein